MGYLKGIQLVILYVLCGIVSIKINNESKMITAYCCNMKTTNYMQNIPT